MPAPPAGVWRRLMTIAYEGVILFGVVFFFAYAFSSVTGFRGAPGVRRWGLQAVLLVILAAYFAYFWSNGRRSLPMKTLSVQLLGRDDAPVGPARALLRFGLATAWIVACLAAAEYLAWWLAPAALLPLAWTLVDRDRRALYDLACGTRLAVTPVVDHARKR